MSQVRGPVWDKETTFNSGMFIELLLYCLPNLITPSSEVRTYRHQEDTAMSYSQATNSRPPRTVRGMLDGASS